MMQARIIIPATRQQQRQVTSSCGAYEACNLPKSASSGCENATIHSVQLSHTGQELGPDGLEQACRDTAVF